MLYMPRTTNRTPPPPPPPTTTTTTTTRHNRSIARIIVRELYNSTPLFRTYHRLLVTVVINHSNISIIVQDGYLTIPVQIVEYALLHHRKFMVVVFPGSKKREDWMSERGNLMILPVEKLDGKVHEGFSKQVDSFWEGLKGQLKKRQLKKRRGIPVVLVGHSRGGACALISALWIERSLGLKRIEAVITFGQPACIDRAIAMRIDEKWGERYLRAVTSTDPVPVLLKDPFYHAAGKVWFFDKSDTLLNVNPMSEVKQKAIHRDNPAKQTEDNDSMFRVVVVGLNQVWMRLKGHQHNRHSTTVHICVTLYKT